MLRRARDDLGVVRHELAALDEADESRLELLGEDLADPGMDFNVGPFADEIEMIGVVDVAAQHAVLHLGRRFVHRVDVGIVELVEQPDELVAASRLHAKIVDVKIIALAGQRYERHASLRSGETARSRRSYQARPIASAIKRGILSKFEASGRTRHA